jgi:hypothetical protein
LAVVTLIRDLDLHPNWEPAQEVLYQALLEDHEPGLAQLGEALGLAVERLGKL